MQPHFTLSYHNMQHSAIMQYTIIMYLCNSLRMNIITTRLTSAYNWGHEQGSLANEGHKSN